MTDAGDQRPIRNEQGLLFEIGIFGTDAAYDEIELAAAQQIRDLAVEPFGDRDVHPRRCLYQNFQRLRYNPGRGDRRHPDPDRAFEPKAAQPHFVPRPLEQRLQRLGVEDQALAHGVEPGPLPAALEHGGANLALQRSDAAG